MMLHEDDDPLSTSLFDNTANSILGNTMSSSMFVSQYEEDPWGNHTTSIPTPSMNDLSRSFTSPALSFNTNDLNKPAPNILTVSNVLSGVRLPEIYETLFTQNQRSGRVSLSSLNNILTKGRISAYHIEQIMQIVVPNGASYVTQNEFNTAIALMASAQNNNGLSLDSLYKNRNYLPEPYIHSEDTVKSNIRPTLDHPINPEPRSPHLTAKTTNGYPGMKSPRLSTDESISKSAKKLLDTTHWFQNVEEVAVTVAPEREGFIFKHVNYIVTNEKRSSIVLRRYSDFCWLLEVLLRRYPFRALPNLPPKKLGGRDAAFLEKRRKGLSRFINAVIRHPILRQDEIVSRFLTEPSELSAWRKQNPPILDEEFKRKQHPPIRELDAMVPENLDEQLQKAKKKVGSGINHYINLCFIMERMIRRMHGQATDFSRYSIALNSLAESELRYHAGECRNCQQVVRGYETVAKHMQSESNILEDQVVSSTDGVLENLKRFRDLLVSFRDLDERRSKLSVNQTDIITKRLIATRAKVHQNKGVPGLEAEVEKLEESVRMDEKELACQQDRMIFIRFCMWSELIYLHKQQAFISTLYQNFVKSTVNFSKLRAENWQELEPPTFEMPDDVNLFE
ncbi:hypothetical protein BDB01DRAFT_808137 [Pilobolus umbonatus]|nr:hypothetical protein BDB01DRAFT_808137 [Pilobolus umbonatus]